MLIRLVHKATGLSIEHSNKKCQQSSGWTVKRPASWANGGPRACFSMKTFGGPY